MVFRGARQGWYSGVLARGGIQGSYSCVVFRGASQGWYSGVLARGGIQRW